jgi:hypothetical protein
VSRLRWAWELKTWPWKIPWQVKLIGTERPPEHVFRFFRALHGIPEPVQAEARRLKGDQGGGE